jgi:hypothetical protein
VRIEAQVGAAHVSRELHVEVRHDRRITLDLSEGDVHICFDENHAAALVLALQAAVAEIQARAVSQ